ncbi:hypothetical protein [Streptomyces sp. CB03238]|uniref:hypothetical protein n=1 Tax=Streptomyces sp. CB03238 TaxID=1907777 RepID=UPI000A10D098|nr:hypothetical protein [Streptomyces sp. CB03238]
MSGKQHPTTLEEQQPVELHPPVDDDGWYASQVRDWVSVSPELSDAAIRLYLILRALVIDKRGPVRKLTLWELCHLMPGPGETRKPSSVSRIRNLLRELTRIGLVTTPEGLPLTTSSRALAAGRGLRIRINLTPRKPYTGPRNVFEALDDIRDAAAESARKARARELELAAQKRAKRSQEKAGQNSDPGGAGQNSDPLGQNSDPLGQNSDPHPGADLQDREPPLSLSAQSFRSGQHPLSVRPSVQVDEGCAHETEGRTDGGEGEHQDQDVTPAAGSVVEPAAAGAAPDNSGSNGGEGARPGPVPVDPSPGVLVLRAIGAEFPEWSINHAESLRDQGRFATGMLESGFTPQEIRHALVSRPLPQPMTHTVAAVVGRRLKDLLATGPAGDVPLIPAQTGRPQHNAADDAPSVALPDSYAETQARLAAEVAGHGKLRPCQGDDGLCDQLAVSGSDLCGKCLNGGVKPLCVDGCGRKVVAPGARCIPCADLDTPSADIGDCPGWDGKPCGRAVVTAGLCRHCKFESEKAKHAADEEWEAARAAAVEAAQAAEPTEVGAPF